MPPRHAAKGLPKFLMVAARMAEHSSYKQKLGAVIAKGSRVLGKGYNHFRQHRFSSFYTYPNVCHAETSALLATLRVGSNRKCLTRATLYVARVNSSGELRMAKPCPSCTEMLKQVGITRIVYSTNGGYIAN